MTPTPNEHRRVRECPGEWRKRCILHFIIGGNTRAVGRTAHAKKRSPELVMGHPNARWARGTWGRWSALRGPLPRARKPMVSVEPFRGRATASGSLPNKPPAFPKTQMGGSPRLSSKKFKNGAAPQGELQTTKPNPGGRFPRIALPKSAHFFWKPPPLPLKGAPPPPPRRKAPKPPPPQKGGIPPARPQKKSPAPPPPHKKTRGKRLPRLFENPPPGGLHPAL